jgi:hypothetical protein
MSSSKLYDLDSKYRTGIIVARIWKMIRFAV